MARDSGNISPDGAAENICSVEGRFFRGENRFFLRMACIYLGIKPGNVFKVLVIGIVLFVMSTIRKE